MKKTPLKIGIIGAGFSGTAVAAALQKLSVIPLEIILFDKHGEFGVGAAYRTPFPYHLLNVRAKDMSAFEDEPKDFVNWLNAQKNLDPTLTTPIDDKFVPRMFYRSYLSDLLQKISTSNSQITLTLKNAEVIAVKTTEAGTQLTLADNSLITVDKVILALGNNTPDSFPFPVSPKIKIIDNSWEYQALTTIPREDPVLIIGTGLSMIDAVLTLHHRKHIGKIYALSRHGLMPLPHSENQDPYTIYSETLPNKIRPITKFVRSSSRDHLASGGDWRSIISALRYELPRVWKRLNWDEKKRFLRHVAPYWNIHRHRVHFEIADLLTQLIEQQQLQILSGRILKVDEHKAQIKLRHSQEIKEMEVSYLINCMGPSSKIDRNKVPLINSLIEQGLAQPDPLNLGLMVTPSGSLKTAAGDPSSTFYLLGSLRKGTNWECSAVPDIRKHAFDLARHLLELV